MYPQTTMDFIDYWNEKDPWVQNQEVILVRNMGLKPRNKDDGILQDYRRYASQFICELNLQVPIKFRRSELFLTVKTPTHISEITVRDHL